MRFLALFLLAALLAGCSGGGGGAVGNVVSGTTSSALEWVEVHGVDAPTLEARLQELGPRGFRLTSLGMSGTTAAPRYAAVLVKQDGPAWSFVLGVSEAQLTTTLGTMAGQGMHPTQIVALGDTAQGLFSARVEAMAVPTKWFTTLTDDEFGQTLTNQPQLWPPYNLRNFSPYDGANRVAAVYAQDTTRTPFSLYFGQDLPTARAYEAVLGQVRYRRAFQTPGDASTGYGTLWTSDVVAGQRDVNGLTPDEWEEEVQRAAREGLVPLYVQAGGDGADTRYSASFAPSLRPVARHWTVTGYTASAQLAAFDGAVQTLMGQNGIRAATLAVAWRGRLVAARGYTWAEPGYPVTQPTTTLRIASVSKPVTTVAIHQLIQEGLLSYHDTMQSILQLPTPVDPRWNHVTVQQLLAMVGGWDDTLPGTFDPMFYDDAIAQALGVPLPVTKYQIAGFMTTQPLQHNPGTHYAYSNFGFSLLGQILERKRPGQTYTQSVQETIWGRLGVTRPFLASVLQGDRAPGEAEYQSAQTGVVPSVMTADQPLVPVFYGGENVTNMDSHGGWVLAAPDYVKMLAAFDRGALNPLLDEATTAEMFSVPFPVAAPGMANGWFVATLPDASGTQWNLYNWDGWLDSDASVMTRRADGLSLVLLTNQGTLPELGWPQMVAFNDVANTITDWGTADLFPLVGIPSFAAP